jgi:hypothetical protein
MNSSAALNETTTLDGTTNAAPHRRRTRRSIRLVITLLATSIVGVVGVSATAAHAAYQGYAECAGSTFDGSITIHPGNVGAGVVAAEYLYVASGGAWQYTGVYAWATSRGNGNWNTLWNVISIHPLPYHKSSYAVREVLTYGGRVIGDGWYNSYDRGGFSSPRYTSSCYWAY